MSDSVNEPAGEPGDQPQWPQRFGRRNIQWGNELLGISKRIGKALVHYERESGKTISFSDPEMRKAIRAAVQEVLEWHSRYSEWRKSEGIEFSTVDYGELPPAKTLRGRVVRAGKELAYREALGDRSAANAAVRDFLNASMEVQKARLEARRKRAEPIQADAGAVTAQPPASAPTVQEHDILAYRE